MDVISNYLFCMSGLILFTLGFYLGYKSNKPKENKRLTDDDIIMKYLEKTRKV